MGLFIVTDLFKKLNVLKDVRIAINSNVNFRNLYLEKKILLVDGTIGYKDKLTDEYLLYNRAVFTGLPTKSYTNNWSTFRELTTAYLVCNETDFILSIRVDEGESCYGLFTGIRWNGNFRVSVTDICLFENDINNEFDSEIDRQFVREEEIRIQKEKDKIRAKLLA